MKISDNNIENIYNININIQGVFTNNIEQDIVNVVAGLLNKQGVFVGASGESSTLKDQLMALARSSKSKDLNIDVPVNSSGNQFSFDGLASKLQEVITKKSEAPKESSDMDDLVRNFISIEPKADS